MECIDVHIASKTWLRERCTRTNFQLPEEVKAYYQSIRNPSKKEETQLAYFFLFDILEKKDLKNFEGFGWSPKGKPYFKSSDLHFNLTHSYDYIGLAIGRTPVGIDLQVTQKVNEKVLKRIATQEEMMAVNNGDVNFFQLWTRKEAVLKMTGDGLAAGASNVSVLEPINSYNSKNYFWQELNILKNIYGCFATQEKVEWTLRIYR